MSDSIISINNLSKRYLIGSRPAPRGRYLALREVIAHGARDLARKANDLLHGREVKSNRKSEFWALRNVSFAVKEGEVVGIIGRNGAGKSTLLKILSRITEPTEGRIELHGRVASLLEIGTGFHPELTGRENIFLNGAILGMTQREIRKKFDEIVAFAEVERFLDTPVKRFSSGMYVRLAFAVAAHLEPDILIVDEVLAVGDAAFQKKCLGKMDEVSRREGRTVLFVSHNMSVVATLCSNTVWLDGGRVLMQGNSRRVIGEYLLKSQSNHSQVAKLDDIPRRDREEGVVRLTSLEWLSRLPLQHGEPMRGRLSLAARAPLSDLKIALGFSNLEGGRLLTYEAEFSAGLQPSLVRTGQYSIEFETESLPLTPDVYSLDISCGSGDVHALDDIPAAGQVEVVAGPRTPAYMAERGSGVHLALKCFLLEGAGPVACET